jgi:hypothetical protein
MTRPKETEWRAGEFPDRMDANAAAGGAGPPQKPAMELASSASSEPISNSAKRGGIGVALFGSFFALFGFGFFIPVFCLPMIHIIEARTWREVPCTVLHSEVVSHAGSKGGSTYSIKISFKYDFGDIHYVATRYDFSVGSSSGRDYRQAIVRRLHRGAHAVCYVNPNRPAEAVIDRGMPRDMWFGLIPLIFVIVGISIIVFAVRNAHPKPIFSSSTAGGGRGLAGGNPAHLKAVQSPLVKLLAIGFFTLFWNGIVSVFVYNAYFNSRGPADWFLRIFLVPFLLVGLGTIVLWFYQVLALFNPRPQIVLMNQAISLGQSCELRWSFTGNFSRISRLTIVVEGREQATCQRSSTSPRKNSDTFLENSTFARLRVADTTRQMDIGAGRGIFTIPADTMHSFSSRHNKIIWLIVLHGEISGWPDVKAEFPINVAPLAIKGVHA